MAGKHVHFGRTVRFDIEPSPTTSISSLPSSAGPITPPSHYELLPPQHHRYAQATKPPAAQLHPLLLVVKPRAVNFDITIHPSLVTTSYSSLSARPGLLSEPAVSPPVRYMALHIPTTSWIIEVRPVLNGAYITVSDVLNALYYGLRENIRKEEFYALPGKDAMKKVTNAYERRYRRLGMKAGDEKRAGIKRVDFLLAKVWFAGLTKLGSDSWLVHVS